MKWNVWKRRKGSKSALTRGGQKASRTAKRHGKSQKQADVLAFKVDNFQRSSKARGKRKKRAYYKDVY